MPISEDEYEIRSPQESVTMSKAELRKTHKPIMEKRRRARINHCLNEIKTLILEAMNKDPARHSKLEKADILEMAVKHLQNVQKQQLAFAMATDPSVLRKFKSGFNECANEIDRFVNQAEVDISLKERMRSHLQKCIGGIEQVSHFNFPISSLPFVGGNVLQEPASSGDQNNNARMQSIQLIPSRLPSGEIALLLPNSSNLSFPRTSAFAAVVPSTSTTPPSSPNRGFRPVHPNKSHSYSAQVPQVSSTISTEVKTMKFPIQKKIEPLCIITNQSERYKQAQSREDAADFEENRGVKRKFSEISHGLLTVAPEYGHPAKMTKTETVTSSASDSVRDLGEASTSREGEGSSDMWRPW